MLKRIVEHNDVDAMGNRLTNAPDSVRGSDHRHSRIESLVNSGLVTAVTAEHNRRLHLALAQLLREPRCNWSLPCPANCHVTDAQHRNGEFFRLQ
jgi:hypothetical protein